MLRPYTSRTALSTVAVPRELVQRQRAPAGARERAHLAAERAAAHPRDTERERPPDQVVAKHWRRHLSIHEEEPNPAPDFRATTCSRFRRPARCRKGAGGA